MPNLFKYSLSTQTQALRKGDYYLAIGDVAKGPTDTSGYWNGSDLAGVKYGIYLNKPNLGPSIYAPINDADLIVLTNKIAGTSYSTVGDCLAWFMTQNDKIVVNKNYSAITTDGLVLLLDGGFTPSYPTQGTTWYNVGSNTNNGDLVNGPTYDSSGAIVFDGVDDHVDIQTTVNASNPNTVCAIVKLDGNSVNGVIYGPNANGADNWFGFANSYLFLFGTETSDVNNFSIAGNTLLDTSNTRWYFITSTISGSTATMYLNGVQENTTTRPYTIGGWNSRVYLGSRGGGTSRFFKGSIGNVMVYNRALSQAEILRNYYQADIITSGLVLNLDSTNLVSYPTSGTSWYDLSPNANHGTLVSASQFVPGPVPYMQYTGNSQNVETTVATVELNTNIAEGNTVEQFIYGDPRQGNGNMPFSFYNISLDLWWINNQFGINNGNSLVYGINNADQYFLNKWAHVVAYFPFDWSTNYTQAKIWINGVQQNLSIVGGSLTNRTVSASQTVGIGGGYTSGGDNFNWNGRIAVTRIYNRELSHTEVCQNFNAQRSLFGI